MLSREAPPAHFPERRGSTFAGSSELIDENTPKGFRSASPGLPGVPGYPGYDAQTDINPERVALAGKPNRPIGRNPFRVQASFCAATQGSPTKVGLPWAALRNAFSVTLRTTLSKLCSTFRMSHFVFSRGPGVRLSKGGGVR